MCFNFPIFTLGFATSGQSVVLGKSAANLRRAWHGSKWGLMLLVQVPWSFRIVNIIISALHFLSPQHASSLFIAEKGQ
jgi:hypothetical protein